MSFIPNFKDPRVIKRLRQALGFALGCLSVEKPTSWAKHVLDKSFGQQQNPLSAWLREQLLICVDQSYIVDVEAKKYILNKQGANRIKAILKAPASSNHQMQGGKQLHSVLLVGKSEPGERLTISHIRDWTDLEYGQELATGRFNYLDKADRLWHPLQNIRRQFKGDLMSTYGFTYDYDMVAAAPTLLLQHAQELGCDLWLPRLNDFLADRNAAREHVAKTADIPFQHAKQLLNSFFNGAKLGACERFSSFELLGHDRGRVRALKADGWLTEFREEIKTLWQYIEESMPRIEKKSEKTGKMRKVPLNAKRKWGRYFELERQVMNSVRAYMKNAKCFYEHDGFKAKEKVDVAALQEHVLHQTGYRVKFERVL